MKHLPSPLAAVQTKPMAPARVGHRPVPRALTILPSKQNRSCGSCQECCTVGSVPELGKPSGVKCEHLRKDKPGCGVYTERPESCAHFKCLWLQGVGPDAYRPDRTGIYLVLHDVADLPGVEAAGVFARDNLAAGGKGVIAFETHRAAARTTGRSMLDELRRSIPIGLVPFPENTFPRTLPPKSQTSETPEQTEPKK